MSFAHQSLVLVREDDELCEVPVALTTGAQFTRKSWSYWEVELGTLMGFEPELRKMLEFREYTGYALYLVVRDYHGNLLKEELMAERLIFCSYGCAMTDSHQTIILEGARLYTTIEPTWGR